MTFTTAHLLNSIAGILKSRYPDYPVYTSPSQQGIDVPCFFVALMPSTISDEVGEKYLRDVGIDVVFIQERNLPNGNSQIYQVQDFFDESFSSIPYSDGSEEIIPLHTFECRSSIEDQELHYQFHVRQRVRAPYTPSFMQVLEDNNVKIKH